VTPTIHLHVGEPKTGTTSLQATLVANAATLEPAGLVMPGSPKAQIDAAQELMGRRAATGSAWTTLAARAASTPARHAVVSMESLVRAAPDQASAAVAAFGADADVRVVLTVRDLARVLPAQWVESLQFRHTWTLAEYVESVLHGPRARRSPARSFWAQHDTGRILQTWVGVVGADRVRVVTVPPSGADPALLWSRFTEALDARDIGPVALERANESVGATSAELLRRLNTLDAVAALPMAEYSHRFRGLLAKSVLAARRGEEPAVRLPAGAWPRVAELAAAQRAEILAAGVRIVGDLDDLAVPRDPPSTAPTQVESQPAEAVLDAALDALVTLTDRGSAVPARRRRRPDREDSPTA
jgi:hypothetical protein